MPRGAGIASGIEVSLLTLFSSYAPPRIGLTSPISVEFADGRKLSESIILPRTQFSLAAEPKLT